MVDARTVYGNIDTVDLGEKGELGEWRPHKPCGTSTMNQVM